MSTNVRLPPFPTLCRPFSLFRPSASLLQRAAGGPLPPRVGSSSPCTVYGRSSWRPTAGGGGEGGSPAILLQPRGGGLSSLHPSSSVYSSSYQPRTLIESTEFQSRWWKGQVRGSSCRGGGVDRKLSTARPAIIVNAYGSNSGADCDSGWIAAHACDITVGGAACCATEGACDVDRRLPSGILRGRAGGGIRRNWRSFSTPPSSHDRVHVASLFFSASRGVEGRYPGPDRPCRGAADSRRGIVTALLQLGTEGIGMAEGGANAAVASGESAANTLQNLTPKRLRGGSVRQLLSELVAESLKAAFPELEKNVAPVVVPCNNPTFGDYQCNNAMALFAQLKGKSNFKNPRAVGEAIIRNLPASPLVDSTSIAGPGFINIKLSQTWLEQRLEVILQDGLSLWAPILPVKRVVVDFSSPNIAKEMHVGHLRSTILGDCLSRMYEFCNVEVLRRNHVGDWGTQFGMLIEFLFEQNPNWMKEDDQAIGDLQNFYKAAKVRFDQDPEFKERAQQAVVRLQGGDELSRLAWKKLCDISRKEFQEIYDKLQVQIEEKGESFYNPLIPSVLERLNEKGLTQMSEGALCIFVPGHNVPLIVRKSDGGFNYASTDLAALWYRINEERVEHVVYVTDVGQSSHFSMFFKAAEMAGWLQRTPSCENGSDDAAATNDGKVEGNKEEGKVKLHHVGFGLVLGSDGKRFRTRSTEVVRLADLLDEAKNRSKKEISERLKEKGDSMWTEEEIEHAAKAVGYGAVKYADLKVNRLTNYTFSFDQMLDTRGNTAVYLLYAHARICSIIRKSGKDLKDITAEAGVLKLEHPMERQLALCLARFSDVVESAVNDLLPNQVCEYLYDLSCKFTDFYSTCNVIGSPEQSSRLLICEVTARVMRMCFQLLGITPLYRL